jgi:hypothetical protein
VLLALLTASAALSAASCLDKPHDAVSPGSAIGGWKLATAFACTQHLTLNADGRFSLESWLAAGSLSAVEQVQGMVSTPSAAMHGQFAARFIPNRAPTGGSAVYCTDWGASNPTTLPFAAASAALGLDALSLNYFPSTTAGLGVVLTGADATRRERLILYRRTAGDLVAIEAADPMTFPAGIFRGLPGDPLPADDAFVGRTLVRVPGEFFKAAHANTVALQDLDQVVLVVTAGVDVTFSRFPNSSGVACSFSLYQDAGFTTQIVANPLDPFAASQTRTFNPAESPWPYDSTAIGSTTAYLIPVAIVAPADGDCEALIRADPIANRVAANHDAAAGAATLFAVDMPDGVTYLNGNPPERPQRFDRIRFTGGHVPLGPFALSGSLTVLANATAAAVDSPAGDPLHLKDGTSPPAVLSVQGASAAVLNVYPAQDAQFGWGPFLPAEATAVPAMAIPESRPVTATADGQRVELGLVIPSAQRIAVWTDGGIRTSGHLVDSAGQTVTTSAGGAGDHAGFRIEADLEAGSYRLRVTASAGAFTLHTAVLPGPAPFADAALDMCMVEAGWALTPGEAVTIARCAGRGIRNIDDIDLAWQLEHLDLGRNGITDIGPLRNLPQLRTVSIAGNPVTDFTPLAGIPLLRQLSLAETSISAAGLSVLQAMTDQLALVDLTGVSTLTPADLDALRAAMPATTIIGPTGTVLP